MSVRTENAITFLVIFLYLGIALATFGHSAANAKSCDAPQAEGGSLCKAITGLISGALWPAYWTWEIAERSKGGAA